jgi:hypothetical protein
VKIILRKTLSRGFRSLSHAIRLIRVADEGLRAPQLPAILELAAFDESRLQAK